MRVNGRLLRTWKSGQAKLKGYLEDYAMVAAALLELYAATFDRLWLDEARGLADDMLRLFWDEGVGGFFDTGVDHERLIVRPRNLYDNAVPCGSSVAVEVLLRLAAPPSPSSSTRCPAAEAISATRRAPSDDGRKILDGSGARHRPAPRGVRPPLSARPGGIASTQRGEKPSSRGREPVRPGGCGRGPAAGHDRC